MSKSNGAKIANDAADFSGINGCYLYTGRNAITSKFAIIKDHTLVLSSHEGIAFSEIWKK